MKNTKFRRILVLLACAVLLVSLSVGATLAYLTSTTQTVKNTFTVGKVNITLDEVKLNENGEIEYEEDDGETAIRTKEGNTEVHLLPGRNIPKDPTVTVLAGSEDCYVRVKVTVDVSEGYKPTDEGTNDTTSWDDEFREWAEHFAGMYIRNDGDSGFNTTDWNVGAPSVDTKESTITYILTYKDDSTGNEKVEKSTSDEELPAVFTHVGVGMYQDNADLAKLKGMKINVVAEAIQADGFKDATAAWEAFAEQKEIEEEFKNPQNPGNQEGSENQN